MTDALRLLAQVAHHQAESAAEDLESIADKQEANLQKNQQLRDLQKHYDSVASDSVGSAEVGGTIFGGPIIGTFAEACQAEEPLAYFDLQVSSGETTPGIRELHAALGDPKLKVAEGLQGMRDLIGELQLNFDDAVKDLKSDDRLGNFEIQDLMSQYNQAEQLRSQAEKRLDTQRKDLTGNWGG